MTSTVPCETGERTQLTGSFAKATLMVFVATGVSNGLLFVVSVIASRWLEPSAYGVVAAMLSVTIILQVPSLSLQLMAARDVASQRSNTAAAGTLFRWRMKQSALIALPIAAASIAFSGPLAGVFNLSSRWPIVLTGLAIVPMLPMTVARGVQQGLGRYAALSTNLIVEGAGRLVVAIVALLLGTGATGVTASPAIGAACAALVGAVALRDVIPVPGRQIHARLRFAWSIAAYYAGLAILTNVDVMVAKHALPPVRAGEYAAVALFGKIVFFLPVAVGVVLASEVARRKAHGEATRPLLTRATLVVSGACGGLSIIGFLAPSAVAWLTVGSGYGGAQDLYGSYALAMLGYALVNVAASFALALADGRFAWVCITATPFQVALLFAFRHDPGAMIWSMVGVSGVLASAGLLMAFSRASSGSPVPRAVAEG